MTAETATRLFNYIWDREVYYMSKQRGSMKKIRKARYHRMMKRRRK